MLERDWTAAETLFLKALSAEPGGDFPKHMFAMFALLPLARSEESIALLDEASRIDPLSLFVSAFKAAALLHARRNVEAEAESRRALELDPNFWRPISRLGTLL